MNQGFTAKCPVCGNPLVVNATSCSACKTAIRWQQPAQPARQAEPAQVQNRKSSKPKKNTGFIVAIVILSIVLVATMIALAMFLLGDGKKKDDKDYHKQAWGNARDEEDADVTTGGEVVGGNTEGLAEKTLMFYALGSNLESDSGFMSVDIQEMIDADLPENYKIVLQTGGTEIWHYSGIEDGEVQRFEVTDDSLVELANLGEQNMCDPETLTDFLEFSKENYPAKEYVLVMWNHGGGVPMGFGFDEIFPGDDLSVAEMADAIADADVYFESVILDACLMGTLETVYALRDCTDYLVASENVSWASTRYAMVNYTDMIQNMQLADVEDTYYLEQIVNPYVEDTNILDTTASMSVYRMSQVDSVYEAYVTYMAEVSDEVVNNSRLNDYISARESAEVAIAQSVSNEEQGQNEEDLLSNSSDTFDIVTFANSFKTDGSAHLISTVSNLILSRDTNSAKLNGLAAYAPCYWTVDAYDAGREMFEELEYDETVIEFYDAWVSFDNSSVAASYAWYEDDLVWAYGDPSSDDIQVCSTELTEKDGYYAWEIDTNLAVTAYTALAIVEGDAMYLYGQDEYYEWDDDGDLVLAKPDYWLHVTDGYEYAMVPYYGQAMYDLDENTSACEGGVIAYVNGELAVLYTQTVMDDYSSETTILDYWFVDEDINALSDVYELTHDDTVEFVRMAMYEDGSVEYELISEPMTIDEFALGFYDVDLSDEDCYVYLSLEDIYGEEHETDMVYAY